MKTLKIFLSVLLVIFVSYLLSCDMNKETVSDNPVANNGGNNFDTYGDCNAPPEKCPVPSYCDSGRGVHICLDIIDGSTDQTFSYQNIKRAIVTHTGFDCDSNAYYCRYITSSTNPTASGCVLPWCNNKCIYTRSICLETYDNKYYTGSRTFGYNGFQGAEVTVYETDIQCDFGGIERNDD